MLVFYYCLSYVKPLQYKICSLLCLNDLFYFRSFVSLSRARLKERVFCSRKQVRSESGVIILIWPISTKYPVLSSNIPEVGNVMFWSQSARQDFSPVNCTVTTWGFQNAPYTWRGVHIACTVFNQEKNFEHCCTIILLLKRYIISPWWISPNYKDSLRVRAEKFGTRLSKEYPAYYCS